MPIRYIILLLSALVLLSSCADEDARPGPDSEEYRQAVSDFYVSLAASETDEARFAFNKMNEIARQFPEEAAAWANLGVFAMRQGNFDLAGERLSQARDAAPGQPEVLYLSGMYSDRVGDIDAAVSFYDEAARAAETAQHPNYPRMLFSLMQALERQDEAANAGRITGLLEQLYEVVPENQAVLYESARLAIRDQNEEQLSRALEELAAFRTFWPDEATEQFELLQELAGEQAWGELSLELVFLRNMLEPTPEFQDDAGVITFPPTQVGFLIESFLWLPQPVVQSAAPDTGMRFEPVDPAGLPDDAAPALLKSATLLDGVPPFTIYIAGGELIIDESTRLPFPGPTDAPLMPAAVAEIDYNYTFRNDIAVAGAGGFRLYRQNDDESFTDVRDELRLPDVVLKGNYHGVWPADIDLDGDLDLVLGRKNDAPLVLINRADGSFGTAELFTDTEDLVSMYWADMDADGGADALFLSANGTPGLYQNLRANEFVHASGFPELQNVAAIATGDMSGNGYFEVIILYENGQLSLLEFDPRHQRWDERPLELNANLPAGFQPGQTTLFVVDADNNGSPDIIYSNKEHGRMLLGDGNGGFSVLEMDQPGRITSIYDVNGNERLDLIGSTDALEAFELRNIGERNYNAYSIRARASGTDGDRRINSFGIGGEMEIRAGLQYQKQLITSPIVHFGLGEYEEAEMLRIIWPNGSVQAEFAERGMGATIFNEQVLKGSCPWLFTNDGDQIHFITDILWRSPLGLRINAQETAGVIQTLDRVRIPAEKLKPTENGNYDVRVTAELWETHFFDHISLVAVDHPEDSEVFIDERFVFPAPDLSARLLRTPRPVAQVSDQNGRDLSETVSRLDSTYIAPFRKTSFQGLVEPHFIEITLDDAAGNAPEWLVLSGWLRPTDSSINLMLSQGTTPPPTGLRVEVADGNGGWQLLHENYGIPAGKLKTILMDIENVFPDENDRRLRLHTSSEIYWDAIMQTEQLPDAQLREQTLPAERMELRYRGFSRWARADSTSPKLPYYDEISSTQQRWRDLEGFHTRFGDVTELLADIDDRYVIMNAGDEMRLEFEAPAPPEAGMKRSFILVSDGWVKDGDYNTEASKTVHPLPFHGQADYEYTRGGRLQDDPVFQRFPEDWANYHTRYITPEGFRTALRFGGDRSR
jgi:tetratricopeptide (TPR) repeat protein